MLIVQWFTARLSPGAPTRAAVRHEGQGDHFPELRQPGFFQGAGQPSPNGLPENDPESPGPLRPPTRAINGIALPRLPTCWLTQSFPAYITTAPKLSSKLILLPLHASRFGIGLDVLFSRQQKIKEIETPIFTCFANAQKYQVIANAIF